MLEYTTEGLSLPEGGMLAAAMPFSDPVDASFNVSSTDSELDFLFRLLTVKLFSISNPKLLLQKNQSK